MRGHWLITLSPGAGTISLFYYPSKSKSPPLPGWGAGVYIDWCIMHSRQLNLQIFKQHMCVTEVIGRGKTQICIYWGAHPLSLWGGGVLFLWWNKKILDKMRYSNTGCPTMNYDWNNIVFTHSIMTLSSLKCLHNFKRRNNRLSRDSSRFFKINTILFQS